MVITSTSNATSITSQLAVHSSLPEHAGYYQCMARDGTDATLCSSHVPHPCIGMSMLSETGWIYVVPRKCYLLLDRVHIVLKHHMGTS